MRYVFAMPGDELNIALYGDLFDQSNVFGYFTDEIYSSFILNRIKYIHTSLRINSKVDLPFKILHYNKLLNMVCDNDCIILTHIAAGKIGKKILNIIRKQYSGIRMVLLLLDSFDAHSPTLFRAWNAIGDYKWDLILSFDKGDSDKYGFTYMGQAYYSINNKIIASNNISDVYYIGACKNDGGRRLNNLLSIEKRLFKNDISYEFIVVENHGVDNGGFLKEISNTKIKIYNSPIGYKTVLSDVLASNCILEILQDGQSTQTLRYFEAVCYNKKLLTNNPNIADYPYYDSRYMKVFSKPEDIDVEWVKKRENIDYGYKGDFSPVGILDIIEKNLGK